MTTVYVGLGSNLDEPAEQLQRAVAALRRIPASRITKESSFYASKPLGARRQPDYLNAVVGLETHLSPHTLLNELQAIEKRQGRVRNEKWGPRTLDLDILLYGDKIFHDQRLTIPHAEMHKRGFVLLPLEEIAPDCVVPGLAPVRALLNAIDAGEVNRMS